jgi:hypothetical protein
VELLEHRLGRRRGICKQARALACINEQGLEQLPNDSERELALEVAPVRGEDSHAPRAGVLAELGDQPGFPDSRRALDDDEPRVPTSARAQEPIECTKLPLPLE